MQRQRYLRSVAVVVIGLAAGVARAQLTRQWTGAGADNRWSNPTNWNTGVPLPGDLAVLGNSASNELQVIDLDVNASVSRLSATATGSRDYHITTANGSSITLTGSHDIYCVGRTAALTIDCDVWTTSADLQVDRIGGVTTLNGNCGGAYLYVRTVASWCCRSTAHYVYQYGARFSSRIRTPSERILDHKSRSRTGFFRGDERRDRGQPLNGLSAALAVAGLRL